MYLRMIQLEDANAKLSSDLTKVGIPLLSPEDANIDRCVSIFHWYFDQTHLENHS